MNYSYKNINKSKVSSIVLIIIILIILLLLFYSYYQTKNKIQTQNNKEGFYINTDQINTTKSTITIPTPIDRTKLYGSLFLDNLDKNIKSMSDPDIIYEEKRIELNAYSDILL